MSTLSIDTTDSGIDVSVTTIDGVMNVAIVGSAEIPAVEVMGRVCKEVHANAQANGVAAVVLDFTQLEFMSSSCFKVLITWVNDVTELDLEKRYQIRFRSNPQILWQRRSLHVLKTMATDIISIES